MLYPEGLMHRKVNIGLALLIIFVIAGIFAWIISARAVASGSVVIDKFFWGGQIKVTLPCYYIPLGSPSPCPAGWMCPCIGVTNCQCSCKEQTPVAPLNYKVFMDPEDGGVLPEPAYCHPSTKEIIVGGKGIPRIVLPTGDLPEPLLPQSYILGIGLSELVPIIVATFK